jgi:hypothetical protein
MNLNNFEDFVSETILERGLDYYHDLAVEDLQGMENGQWFAIVEGTQDYQVDVRLDETDEILEYRCTCPYKGEICKHVVAVLYEILDVSEEDEKNTASANANWKQLIQKIPDKDLRTFVTEYAAKDRTFRNHLSIKFSDLTGGDKREKYRELVSDIFTTSQDDEFGFVFDLYELINKINTLFSKAEEYLKNNNPEEAFAIASAIAPECINTMDMVDDSNGDLGEAIDHSFNIADKILQTNAPTELKEEVFDWLLAQARNPDYDDYGCADYLEYLIVEHANSPGSIGKVLEFIDDQLANIMGGNNLLGNIRKSRYLQFKIDLLIQSGEQEKADQIINDNLHLSDLRQIMVDRHLKKGNLQKAIEMIKEGLEIAEKEDLPGVVINWKEQLLNIYQKQKDMANIRKWSLDLFFNSRREPMKYYKIYKNTFNAKEWTNERNRIVQQLLEEKKAPPRYGSYGYIPLTEVYIEEKMWDELFRWIKASPNIRMLNEYLPYLKNDYASELLPLYRKAIIREAEKASNRNEYKALTYYIKKMEDIPGGKGQGPELAKELLRKHSNRPAMKDEFRKAGYK